ncbi:hydroxyethylthiazole kinase [Luteipulveratus halotolerans]|uniref:Hydroxyethylthiazole kinase n=1 Tax=Luteipulveratus halotolerans TaxID=1631356 RepID=A0A0L6CMX2_9MICO|nr:hydroxyethylthiazole kinase [Luteipulveratus halotolerans]KNX38898.1 hydroxyethylthiazole kinase [Luteipulveratus halotolerans]
MTTPRPADLGAAMTALRDRQPLTQCLTNIVVAPWTANVLLAAGAAPAMVDNSHEAGAFAQVAGGVLVNLGTPYDDTTTAMDAAAGAAHEHGTPWVLDPVAAGLPWRTTIATSLLDLRPTIVRGNASEVLALTGGSGGRGVDSTASAQDALAAARALAEQTGGAVAVSGPVDHLTDGSRVVRLGNGHVWMTQVTGVGCALGALMAAYAAVTDDALLAAAAATAHLTVAAELAAERSSGPGSFAVSLLDELAALTPSDLEARVTLT